MPQAVVPVSASLTAGVSVALVLVLLAPAGTAADLLTDGVRSCVALPQPERRLACYDAVARLLSMPEAGGAAPAPELPSAGGADTEPSATAAPLLAEPAAADQSPVEPGDAARWRLQAGGGYGHGAYSGTLEFSIGDKPVELESDSATGGTGYAGFAGLWLDDWLAEGLSLGVEYWRLHQSAKLTVHLPQGLSVLDDPVRGRVRATLNTDMAFVNAAANLDLRDPWSIQLGGGLGYSYTRVRLEFSTTTPLVTEDVATRQKETFHVPVAQVFAGATYDILPPFYIAGGTHFMGGSGKPFGEDHSFYDLLVTLSSGIRF